MEHIKPIIDNLSMCLLAYKHRNMHDVMNDPDIENQAEKYAKAGVLGGSNLMINCLMFNIECVTIFFQWFLKEYKNANVYMKKYYSEYNDVSDITKVNVNEDYVDISNNTVDKKND